MRRALVSEKRARRRKQAFVALFGALGACASAGILTAWDRGRSKWVFPTQDARALLGDQDPDRQRAAIVVLLRDATASIDELHRMCAAGGENAEQARLALEHIANRTGKGR